MCLFYMQCDKQINPARIGRERSKSLALRQIQDIEQQDSAAKKEEE